ncbi:hypothetical protein PACTADRAFT_47559 [Pachysolen tannophilus NRRL Y-2460]|uniref:ATP synthase subunit d, mitochondrial n=1 Tax=Pachysolen tannophilus NRRL Y-2460 TaxID=669874 RepID=A0A1E4U122_PACTA|nr:hypothetical protein PACTADRAFT_47559 [Pachysolen tannophilus NRRL Y-2460]
MSSVGKAAANKLDWSKIISKLGLTGQTASALTSFKKRNDEARRILYELKEESTEVAFDHYKSVLKNQDIVNKIEKDFKSFTPIKANLTKQLNLIESFESKAIENATATESVVLKELEELEKTLSNIESARPFEQLTVQDVVKARPDINDKVTDMVTKGRWEVPGYKEKFGDLTIM